MSDMMTKWKSFLIRLMNDLWQKRREAQSSVSAQNKPIPKIWRYGPPILCVDTVENAL